MQGEFVSSGRADEAVLSAEEILQAGATSASLVAMLLCVLTVVHKDPDAYQAARTSWLEVGACCCCCSAAELCCACGCCAVHSSVLARSVCCY